MGLFEKRRCDVCGAKIRLLGKRSPEEVKLCKSCASKLSPWFTGRNRSSLARIREQLAFREENRKEVLVFQTTRSFGTYTKLYIDEAAKKFLICGSSNFLEANPDVLSFDQVIGFEIEIPEYRYEIRHRDAAGNSVRANPPRYVYSYDFKIILRVRHPFFDEMRFQLNGAHVPAGEHSVKSLPPASVPEFVPGEYRNYLQTAREIRDLLLQNG